MTQNFFQSKKFFCLKIFFQPTIFFSKIFFNKKLFSTKIFFHSNLFLTRNFIYQKSFRTKYNSVGCQKIVEKVQKGAKSAANIEKSKLIDFFNNFLAALVLNVSLLGLKSRSYLTGVRHWRASIVFNWDLISQLN